MVSSVSQASFMVTSTRHYRTSRTTARRHLRGLAAGAVLTATVAQAAAWPSFLPAASHFGEPVVAGVESAFGSPTLTRSVHGEPAPVPLPMYLAFVDAADVTAAAARHLGLARYQVHMLGPDAYFADDRDGNRGSYRVLVREGGRRVILSWGSHSGPIIGTIEGHALSLLEFQARGGETTQKITAWVRLDNAALAAVARALAPLFGGVMDRKLTEGFGVTTRVARWALQRPDEFCDWLEREPTLAERRGDLPAGFPSCATASRDHSAASRTR
jgi:hypothetical protein